MPDIFMKHPFICIATLALLFAACKKDDHSPAPAAVTKYMQSIVSDDGDSTAVEFNIDKSVYRYLHFSADKSFTSFMPSYEPGTGNIISVDLSTDPATGESSLYQSVSYNSMKQISTISFYGYNGLLEKVDSLSYGSGKLDTIYYFKVNPETSQKELQSKYVHTWDTKGNIVKQEEFSMDGLIVTTYTYDNKINPALKVTGYYLINFGEEEVPELLSANNILTSTIVNTPKNYTASKNNTYEYDADNYPVIMKLRYMMQYAGQDLIADSVKLKLYYGK